MLQQEKHEKSMHGKQEKHEKSHAWRCCRETLPQPRSPLHLQLKVIEALEVRAPARLREGSEELEGQERKHPHHDIMVQHIHGRPARGIDVVLAVAIGGGGLFGVSLAGLGPSVGRGFGGGSSGDGGNDGARFAPPHRRRQVDPQSPLTPWHHPDQICAGSAPTAWRHPREVNPGPPSTARQHPNKVGARSSSTSGHASTTTKRRRLRRYRTC
mmetsp:Transcript_11136/g.23374  ORF Transcript_11136/g.23374 Transcript_11136/m.23374 type:complete len:213 (-) Transcript_11136:654-1292(-)